MVGHFGYSTAGTQTTTMETLPIPPPVDLLPGTVHVRLHDEPSTSPCQDGNAANPTAPPGHLCTYPTGGGIWNATNISTTGRNNGFYVSWDAVATGLTGFDAKWAYTAP